MAVDVLFKALSNGTTLVEIQSGRPVPFILEFCGWVNEKIILNSAFSTGGGGMIKLQYGAVIIHEFITIPRILHTHTVLNKIKLVRRRAI